MMHKISEKQKQSEAWTRKANGYWFPQYSTHQIRTTTMLIGLFILFIGAWYLSFYALSLPSLILVEVFIIAMGLPAFVYIQRKEVPNKYGEIIFTGKSAVIYAIIDLILGWGLAILLLANFLNQRGG